MALLDKIMFWKKKPSNDFDMPDLDMPDFSKDSDGPGADEKPPSLGEPPTDSPPDLGMPDFGGAPDLGGSTSPPEGLAPTPDLTPPSVPEPEAMPSSAQPLPGASAEQTPKNDKEMQLISAKLDTLKAQLDSISHRIAHIEKLASEAKGEKKDDVW